MNEDFDYYIIGGDGNPSAPLLRADGDQDTWFLIGDEPVEIEKPMELCFNSPIPRNPKMLDYHSLPDTVVSKKIYEALAPMNVYGIQLVPAVVRNNKTNDIYEDYWVVYVYNEISCVDRNLSEYTVDEDNGSIRQIYTLVLDKKVLENIPLEKRLVFRLGEGISKLIYHKSVVDAIMAVNPEGIRFGKIKDWYEGIQFNK
jgi:hypothetical protein